MDIKQTRPFSWATLAAIFFSLFLLGASFYFIFLSYDLPAVNLPWIPQFGINFVLGINPISAVMILLTTLLTPLILVVSGTTPVKNQAWFVTLMVVMEVALLGVFLARDGFLFYVFWELVLIPAFFMILIWGGEKRVRVAITFLLYSLLGSFFLLASLLFLYLQTPAPHQFGFEALFSLTLSPIAQRWIFCGLFAAFALKLPIFPLHRWQPDTYDCLPTSGSMFVAGLVSKMAVYGVLQFLLPLTPLALAWGQSFVLPLLVISVLYGSVIALKEFQFKRLIAYASIAHGSLILAGVLSGTAEGFHGSLIQTVAHGFGIVGLFVAAQILHRWTGTMNLSKMGGFFMQSKLFTKSFFLIILGSIGLPLTAGFIGEFMILWGIFQVNIVLAGLAGLSIILGAWVMLNVYQSALLGVPVSVIGDSKIYKREFFVMVVVIITLFGLGIFPGVLLP